MRTKTVSNIFKHHKISEQLPQGSNALVLNDCGVGVEIELEEFKITDDITLDCPLWDIKTDPSLRGTRAYEVTFKAPYYGSTIVGALRQMHEYIKGLKTKPDCSTRTSLHVHIDVRDLTIQQLLNMVVVYLSIEKLLYNYVAPHRRENIFCLPLYLAQDPIESLGGLTDLCNDISKPMENKILNSINTHVKKYSGFNLLSTFNYGSVEFRMHHGTYVSDNILRWVNILMCIKKYAQNLEDSPINFPMNVSSMGVEQFVLDIFGDKYSSLLVYEGYVLDVIEGVRLAQDVIYSKEFKSANMSFYESAVATSDSDDLFNNFKGF